MRNAELPLNLIVYLINNLARSGQEYVEITYQAKKYVLTSGELDRNINGLFVHKYRVRLIKINTLLSDEEKENTIRKIFNHLANHDDAKLISIWNKNNDYKLLSLVEA